MRDERGDALKREGRERGNGERRRKQEEHRNIQIPLHNVHTCNNKRKGLKIKWDEESTVAATVTPSRVL